jgi:hypothetical protein
MTKIDMFRLDVKYCQPHSGISQFFDKTLSFKWNRVDLFTRFAYDKNPIISPPQVLDMYSQNLSDITKIKGIDNEILQYVRNTINKQIVRHSIIRL